MSLPLPKGSCCTILRMISGGMAGDTRLSMDEGGTAEIAMLAYACAMGLAVTNAFNQDYEEKKPCKGCQLLV